MWKLARLITCQYRTEDGTGISGIDYEEATGTLEFPDQEAAWSVLMRSKDAFLLVDYAMLLRSRECKA